MNTFQQIFPFLTKVIGQGYSNNRDESDMTKILIVEDDRTLLKMYQTKLTLENFEVEAAYDGEEGLEKLKTTSPNLVLLDLAMPKLDGFEFLKKMMADASLKKIPVVVFSNLGQESDVEKAKDLGAKDYLIKANLTPKQVVEKIKQYL